MVFNDLMIKNMTNNQCELDCLIIYKYIVSGIIALLYLFVIKQNDSKSFITEKDIYQFL